MAGARGLRQFAGWEAFHVAIDAHSRLSFTQLLPNQQARTPISFLRDAIAGTTS